MTGATIVDTLFGNPSPDVILLVTSLLLYLGYLGLRVSGRLRVPLVTMFLLLGILIGPSGLNLVGRPILEALSVIEPIALGLITFSAGEQLVFRDIAGLPRRHFAAIGLETFLPMVLAAVAVGVVTGRADIALPLGAIAGTTGVATVMTTLKEKGAKGSFTRLLSIAMATDNVAAILVFTLVLPLAMALEQVGGAGVLYLESLLGVAFAVGAGAFAGVVLSRNIARMRSSSQLSMFVLAHLLLVVGITNILGYSVLLAGLSMGIVAVNTSSGLRERERLFTALTPLEDPLIAVFFLWAGAGLHVAALGEVGIVAAVYVVARAAGKWAGPWVASLGLSRSDRAAWELRTLGLGLTPQAGAAIGLGILARDALPTGGGEILTVVLGAVVLFELTGPLAVARAIAGAGEAARPASPDQPMTLGEAVRALEEQKGRIMMVSDRTTSVWQVANTLSLAERLRAEVVILPLGEGSPRSGSEGGGADPSPVPALLEYARSHEQDVTVLDPAFGSPVPSVIEAARLHTVDLIVLAWGPLLRRHAGLIVDQAGSPVVELPAQRRTRPERPPFFDRALTVAGAGFRSPLVGGLSRRLLRRDRRGPGDRTD